MPQTLLLWFGPKVYFSSFPFHHNFHLSIFASMCDGVKHHINLKDKINDFDVCRVH